MSTNVRVYKGKVTHRSWPQLPEELVRHIATFFLWDLSATSYCPQVWDLRENWHPRMVYTVLRDASDLERFMSISPQWSHAVENHLFWQQAIALIDPVDFLGHHAIVYPPPKHNSSTQPLPTRLTPYHHFRNITSCSCIVCRINAPGTTQGLTLAKRPIHTPFLGLVQLCREHDRHRLAFCGICLREAPIYEKAHASVGPALVACMENEDEDSWPGVEATCRMCRKEWLWRRVSSSPRDVAAIGGASMVSEDWETRQCVDGFIELGEGTIADVINIAREKYWLRRHTRLGDMLSQALAATKFNNGSGTNGRTFGCGGNLLGFEGVEEEEEEEEDDVELIQMTEEGGVRDLALGDWARQRILDGHWLSPADQWYGTVIPGHPMSEVKALHPCPWTISGPSSPRSSNIGGSVEEPLLQAVSIENIPDERHPKPSTVHAEIPPSYALCEQAYLAHQKQMRVVLLAPMRNIVRRLVIECSAHQGARWEDPAMRATRMAMEDVLRVLREEEGIWFDGFDWAERRRNERIKEREQAIGHDESSSTSTSTPSSGRSSNTTSPVLSTTTLQTTPSPPPLSVISVPDEKKDDDDGFLVVEIAAKPTIPISPVLDPPRMLRPIPYVPVTIAHMPHYSLEAFKAVWREACAPLYHCRCTICERAMTKANNPDGSAEGPAAVVPSQVPPQSDITVPDQPLQIYLEDSDQVHDLDTEDEYEAEEEEVDYSEVGPEEEEESYYSEESLALASSKKRSCEELDLDDYDGDRVSSGGGRGATPPKRARWETAEVVQQCQEENVSIKMKKRSSEELADDGPIDDGCNKRLKVASGQSIPTDAINPENKSERLIVLEDGNEDPGLAQILEG
ncbi:hypothetical protein BD779DRAFT_1674621 [Infundibulicybe gibba]|nr:hypothetical protein BD779DRAFT_1674621 [Infundibulicybe gibba]